MKSLDEKTDAIAEWLCHSVWREDEQTSGRDDFWPDLDDNVKEIWRDLAIDLINQVLTYDYELAGVWDMGVETGEAGAYLDGVKLAFRDRPENPYVPQATYRVCGYCSQSIAEDAGGVLVVHHPRKGARSICMGK